MTAQLTNPADIDAFITGGKATFTLVSISTGARFTFKVSEARNETGLFFVSVLNGPDNWNNYAYLGLLQNGGFRHTAKSQVSQNAKSFDTISWFFRNWAKDTGNTLGQVQFWHEGKCGACGRKLTVPASIERGLGPVCAEAI